jgi:hypothetical protein
MVLYSLCVSPTPESAESEECSLLFVRRQGGEVVGSGEGEGGGLCWDWSGCPVS